MNPELKLFTEFVTRRLLLAQWITAFAERDDGSYTLHWTAPGAQRAVLIRKIMACYSVRLDAGTGEIALDVRTQFGRLDAARILGGEVLAARDCLGTCLADLALYLDGERLQLFAQVVREWPNLPDAGGD